MPYKPVATVFGETGTHASKMELDVQIALYWGNNNCNFVPFEEGQHYDIFFENIDLKPILATRNSISESEICIDLFALSKRKYGNKRYILTTRKLQCHVMESYDLNMRPHDANVLLNMHGKGIYLYDTKKKEKNGEYRLINRLEYDFAGIHGPEALAYGIFHCLSVLFRCLGLKK